MYVNNRINRISEYHFHKLDLIKKDLINQGKDITDLSIGDPDLPVQSSINYSLIKSLNLKDYNKYPPYDGIEELKRSIIKYYKEVFNVKLEMDEVIILIGSKEGINNLIPAVCDIGDFAIIPKPSYPVYESCCKLWGVNSVNIAVNKKDLYLPKIEEIENNINAKCRLLVLNYPNNPTGAVANGDFYKDMIKLCKKYEIAVYNDGAYNEIIGVKQEPLSILQFDDDKYSIEFGTFSKTFNMTGYRIGYAVGNASIIKLLIKIKSNVDSGQFIPIQYAAVQALNIDRDYISSLRKIYEERKKAAENILKEKGIGFFYGKGTFYIWCSAPRGYSSVEFCEELLYKHGIVVTPGAAFNENDNEHFRIALTKSKEQLVNALSKIKSYN